MATQERTGRGKSAYLCGTPSIDCQGQVSDTSAGLRSMIKRFHRSRADAILCYKHHLEKLGYVRVGSMDYRAPEALGGRVLMLGRAGKFGALLRPGKGGRSMPLSHGRFSSTGGTFI